MVVVDAEPNHRLHRGRDGRPVIDCVCGAEVEIARANYDESTGGYRCPNPRCLDDGLRMPPYSGRRLWRVHSEGRR